MKKDITDLPSGVQAQIRALETLAILLQDEDAATAGTVRQLAVAAHVEGGSAEIEFVTALEGVNGENMEDYLVYLSSQPPVPDEREVSFRLLRHYASSMRHQKYHDVDIVTVNVEGPRKQRPRRSLVVAGDIVADWRPDHPGIDIASCTSIS